MSKERRSGAEGADGDCGICHKSDARRKDDTGDKDSESKASPGCPLCESQATTNSTVGEYILQAMMEWAEAVIGLAVGRALLPTFLNTENGSPLQISCLHTYSTPNATHPDGDGATTNATHSHGGGATSNATHSNGDGR